MASKSLYDEISAQTAELITKKYSVDQFGGYSGVDQNEINLKLFENEAKFQCKQIFK